jgi:type VI secretion system protein ImpE
MAVSMYRSLLAAEEERARAYAGKAPPNVAPEAEAAGMVHDRIAALTLVQNERWADAQVLLARAQNSEAPRAGSLDSVAFASLADYDELLGPVLEVFAGGRYFWVPFLRLQRVEITAPRSSLDLLWLPATIFEHGGVEARVHLPVHYAGTHTHADPLVRAGRKTVWEDVGGVAFRGFGPRLLLADGARDVPLLSVRSIRFGSTP